MEAFPKLNMVSIFITRLSGCFYGVAKISEALEVNFDLTLNAAVVQF